MKILLKKHLNLCKSFASKTLFLYLTPNLFLPHDRASKAPTRSPQQTKSVTHVLNHRCYLCSEPAPVVGRFFKMIRSSPRLRRTNGPAVAGFRRGGRSIFKMMGNDSGLRFSSFSGVLWAFVFCKSLRLC